MSKGKSEALICLLKVLKSLLIVVLTNPSNYKQVHESTYLLSWRVTAMSLHLLLLPVCCSFSALKPPRGNLNTRWCFTTIFQHQLLFYTRLRLSSRVSKRKSIFASCSFSCFCGSPLPDLAFTLSFSFLPYTHIPYWHMYMKYLILHLQQTSPTCSI